MRSGLVLEYFTIGWMFVEVVGALLAGFLASSFALIAFGSDSIVEMISAVVVMKHVRLDGEASMEQDRRTAFYTAVMLVTLLPLIGLSSTYSFFVLKIQPAHSILGVVIAAGAVCIMPVLWLTKRDIGRKTACIPLKIDAAESATCFFMSLALLGSLATEFLFHIGWTDYAATLLILGFIGLEAKESIELTRDRD